MKLFLLVILTLPVLVACGSGASGSREVLHNFDAKAKARKESKEDSALAPAH